VLQDFCRQSDTAVNPDQLLTVNSSLSEAENKRLSRGGERIEKSFDDLVALARLTLDKSDLPISANGRGNC
jgi:hypothetical protein